MASAPRLKSLADLAGSRRRWLRWASSTYSRYSDVGPSRQPRRPLGDPGEGCRTRDTGSGCDRERELLDAIDAGRWAEIRDDELLAHVASCAECSDVAEVATALVEDRGVAMKDAPVPRSGLVWWRMQMRARREAEIAAARTVSAAHGMALTCAIGVALAILGVMLRADSGGWPSAFATALLDGAGQVSRLPVLASWSGPLLLALAAWLALAPIAVWLALTEE